MKTYVVWARTSREGSLVEIEMHVPDDATQDEIDEEATRAVAKMIDFGWEERK